MLRTGDQDGPQSPRSIRIAPMYQAQVPSIEQFKPPRNLSQRRHHHDKAKEPHETHEAQYECDKMKGIPIEHGVEFIANLITKAFDLPKLKMGTKKLMQAALKIFQKAMDFDKDWNSLSKALKITQKQTLIFYYEVFKKSNRYGQFKKKYIPPITKDSDLGLCYICDKATKELLGCEGECGLWFCYQCANTKKENISDVEWCCDHCLKMKKLSESSSSSSPMNYVSILPCSPSNKRILGNSLSKHEVIDCTNAPPIIKSGCFYSKENTEQITQQIQHRHCDVRDVEDRLCNTTMKPLDNWEPIPKVCSRQLNMSDLDVLELNSTDFTKKKKKKTTVTINNVHLAKVGEKEQIVPGILYCDDDCKILNQDYVTIDENQARNDTMAAAMSQLENATFPTRLSRVLYNSFVSMGVNVDGLLVEADDETISPLGQTRTKDQEIVSIDDSDSGSDVEIVSSNDDAVVLDLSTCSPPSPPLPPSPPRVETSLTASLVSVLDEENPKRERINNIDSPTVITNKKIKLNQEQKYCLIRQDRPPLNSIENSSTSNTFRPHVIALHETNLKSNEGIIVGRCIHDKGGIKLQPLKHHVKTVDATYQHEKVISRNHAKLFFPIDHQNENSALNSHILVMDLGSKHGTLIDHQVIEKQSPQKLLVGSTITFGKPGFKLSYKLALN